MEENDIFKFDFLKDKKFKKYFKKDDSVDYYYLIIDDKISSLKIFYEQGHFSDVVGKVGNFLEGFIKNLYNVEPEISQNITKSKWNNLTADKRLKFLKKLHIYPDLVIDKIFVGKNFRNKTEHDTKFYDKDLAIEAIKVLHDTLVYFYNIYFDKNEEAFDAYIRNSFNDHERLYRSRSKYRKGKIDPRKKYRNTNQKSHNKFSSSDNSNLSKNNGPYNFSNKRENKPNNDNKLIKIIVGFLSIVAILFIINSLKGSHSSNSISSHSTPTEEKSTQKNNSLDKVSSSSVENSEDNSSQSTENNYLKGKAYTLSFSIYDYVISQDGKKAQNMVAPNLKNKDKVYVVFSPKKNNRVVITENPVDVVKITKNNESFEQYYNSLPSNEQLKYEFKDKGLTLKIPKLNLVNTNSPNMKSLQFNQQGINKLNNTITNIFDGTYVNTNYSYIPVKKDIEFDAADFTNQDSNYQLTYTLYITLDPVNSSSL